MSPLLSRLGIGAVTGGFGFSRKGGGIPGYFKYFQQLSSQVVDFSSYLNANYSIRIMTAFGAGGTNSPSCPSPTKPCTGGTGGSTTIKYLTTPLSNFVSSYGSGNSVTIDNSITSPFWSHPDTVTVTALGGSGGYGDASVDAPGAPGNAFSSPSINDISNLFPGGYTISAGSAGPGGVGGGDQFAGRGGGGGAGGINITTLSAGDPIPSDPAASPGSGGGSMGGNRVGGNGGTAGGGSYASGGGGAGTGGEQDGERAGNGSGGAGQGGVTIYLITNQSNSGNSNSIYNTLLTDGTISGSSTVGSTLTYTTATFSSNPTSSVSWVWYSSGTVVQTGGSTYTLVSGDVGKNITVKATSTNTAGSVEVISNSIAVYKSAPDTTITFTSSGTFSVPSRSNILIIACDGATGGGGPGGAGGRTVATFTGMAGQSLAISIAGGGVGSASGGCAGECSRYNRPAILSSGGNYAGVFVTSVSQANTLILAGGGGAGGFIDVSAGGAGGGTSGSAGGDASGSSGGPGVYRYGGGGGTQSAGGSGGSGYESIGGSGSALQGGGNATSDLGRSGSGAGGGGYYGGGGGGAGYDSGNYASTAGGGGGSSYIRPDGTSTTNTPGGTQASAGRVVIQY
jgi:hypothetical protein